MNWVDLVVLAIVGVSALLAFLRGLIGEVLGLAAWIGGAIVAVWVGPLARPQFRQWIANPAIADAAALGATFLLAVIVLSIVTNGIGRLVRKSAISGIDHTLGMVFGVVRGAAVIAFAYIALGIVGADNWPPAVLQARSLPYAYRSAAFMVSLLPPGFRPKVQPPPAGRVTKAEDLFHAIPLGRAIGGP